MKKKKKTKKNISYQAKDIIHLLEKGMKCHRKEEYDKAAKAYHKILKVDPNHSEALHLSGLIAHQRGDTERSVRLIERAVRLLPSNIVYLKNLSAILLASDMVEKAVGYLERVLALSPESAELWLELGNSQQKMGAFSKAVDAYEKVLSIQPDHVDAYHNMGAALHGNGAYKEAIVSFKEALKRKPELPEALYNMGNSLRAIGSMAKAIEAMHKALAIKPDYADALFNLAKMYKDVGQTEAAIATYIELLKANPAMAEAHNNLGNLFYDLGQVDQAQACYTQALKIIEDYPEALFNMSIALQDQGELEAAMICSKRAVELQPDYAEAVSSLVHQKREACEWTNLNKLDDHLDMLTRRALDECRRPAEGPFLNLSRCDDPAINLAVAASWSRDLVQKMQAINAFNGKDIFEVADREYAAEHITIGYLSNNFRNHPMAHLLCRLFGLHDRKQFKINCYSYGKDDGSDYRKQIEKGSDRFVDLLQVQDGNAAQIIYADKVDILVDLTGYMKGHRMGICAQRPAPVQVRYLGLAGTTGAEFFDYIIADETIIPESHLAYYTENPVYMPHTYQINNREQSVADLPYKRVDFGLPSSGIVFCAFSSHYKLDPIMFAAWMKILNAFEGSVLWLIPGGEIAQQNLKQQAREHGIKPDRIVFATRLSKPKHLARIKLADIALDTRIVGGAATTSDALWAGVPVITLLGSHFASRMSASIIQALGLSELVAANIGDYVELAVTLARDTEKLTSIKQKLEINRLTQPLFDTEKTVRHLESAFVEMWLLYQQGRKPQVIRI